MMKIYEAADLSTDIYEGEYFQPSVKVYKKNDVDEEIKKKDELLKEMAEALLIAKDIINRYANNNKRIAGYSNIEDALQKYHEQVGDTNAK